MVISLVVLEKGTLLLLPLLPTILIVTKITNVQVILNIVVVMLINVATKMNFADQLYQMKMTMSKAHNCKTLLPTNRIVKSRLVITSITKMTITLIEISARTTMVLPASSVITQYSYSKERHHYRHHQRHHHDQHNINIPLIQTLLSYHLHIRQRWHTHVIHQFHYRQIRHTCLTE